MDIRVSGHQVDVGETLRGRVEERLTTIAEKYFSRVISAQVTFGKGPHDHGFTTEIVAYVPNGVVLKGTDRAADASYRVFEAGSEEEEPADNPPIIAETRVDIPESNVADAVMLLDLRNTNALMFRNSGTGSFNMVYRRGDGTIGWVEPQAS